MHMTCWMPIILGNLGNHFEIWFLFRLLYIYIYINMYLCVCITNYSVLAMVFGPNGIFSPQNKG